MPQRRDIIDLKAPQSGRIVQEDGDVVNLADAIDKSGGIRVITEFQAAVHDGMAFSYTSHGTLAAGASASFLGVTGSKQVHFDGLKIFISQGDLLLEFFENPTVSNNGTEQTMRRRNRANPNRPTITVYANPTVSATGILLEDENFPIIGQGANVESGSVGLDEGWILMANSKYMIRITNNAATSTKYNVKFAWHEADYLV